MLGHALLAVLAATEPEHTPTPTGLIALTCNEIRRLFTPPSSSSQPASSPALDPGRSGDDATNTAPGPATTATDPTHDHGLRLEY